MTRTTRAPRRGAFTLVEVLVVVSMLALLAALATAAFIRVQAGQRVAATDATLSKLKSGLDRKWRAVLDNAKNAAIPDGLMTAAGGDAERARVMLAYMMLKNEFPTTLAEACYPTQVIVTTPAGAVGAHKIPPKQAFLAPIRAKFPAPAVLSFPYPSADESAACFYIAMTATGTRGETFSGEGLQNQVGEVTVKFQVNGQDQTMTLPAFTDTWGMPIFFCRHTYLTEVNGPEYTKAKQPPAQGGPFRDPLDPLGKLATPSPAQGQPVAWTAGTQAFGAQTSSSIQQFWTTLSQFNNGSTVVPAAHWNYGGVYPTTYPCDTPTAAMSGGPQNWVPSLLSAGPNKKLATAAGANFGGDDDQFSFRLAREGNRGN
jgi:prepilin-type N-terminal cleavage/methylation domain-containing protein